MFWKLLFLSAVVCLLLISDPHSLGEEVLPAGTLLQCTSDEPDFSSRTAEIGDPILCHLGAVVAFGRPVFPRGAYLAGHFQEYRDPGRLVGKGWIELTFDRAVLPNAIALPLSAKVIALPHLKVSREGKIQGRGHAKRDALEWMVPVLWPIKAATLPARGPRPSLKGEMRITLRLLEDLEVPSTVLAERRTSSPQTSRLRPSSTTIPLQQPLYESSREFSLSSGTVGSGQELSQAVSPDDSSEGSLVQQPTWLILRDGTSYLVKDYWVEFGKLQCVTLDGERKVLPLARLDLDETVRLNRERRVGFAIRSRESLP